MRTATVTPGRSAEESAMAAWRCGSRVGETVAPGMSHWPASASRMSPVAVKSCAKGGLWEVEVTQHHGRVQLYALQTDFLADNLLVNLALGRNVQNDVALDARRAAQTLRVLERPLACVVGLERAGAERAPSALSIDHLASDPTDGIHLAASTDSTPATHGVQVSAELPRGVEHRGAFVHLATEP